MEVVSVSTEGAERLVFNLPDGRNLVVYATLEDCQCKYGYAQVHYQVLQHPCAICQEREAEDGHVCNRCKAEANALS